MQIDNNEVIKYFDLFINDIVDINVFSIKNTLIDNNRINPTTETEREYFFKLVDNIKHFAFRYKYIDTLSTHTVDWFRLTEKGVQLKEFKKGHLKFVKSLNKSKMTLFEKISVVALIISGCFAFWQQYSKDELKNDYKNLTHQYDSLKVLSDPYKLQLDSCKSVSHFYKSRLDSILLLQAK
ncbi:MAG: hypothetical protein KGZ58_07035 [Ignavibacteriales bacterium]|nr:hypothetical protein [Ignavibacteriales bacterium]